MPGDKRVLSFCAFAVVLAVLLGGSYFALRLGKGSPLQARRQAAEDVRTVTVVRATRFIDFGERFTPENTRADTITTDVRDGVVASQAALWGGVAGDNLWPGAMILDSQVDFVAELPRRGGLGKQVGGRGTGDPFDAERNP